MSDPTKVLFVCTGNICRSPLAHAVFQNMIHSRGVQKEFEVESAGTHGYHVGENADPRMRSTAARRGVPFSHPARKLIQSDLEYYDVIFAMDRSHYDRLMHMAASAKNPAKIHMFREFDPLGDAAMDVPDPYYGGQNGFDDVFDIVERSSERILDALRSGETAGRK